MGCLGWQRPLRTGSERSTFEISFYLSGIGGADLQIRLMLKMKLTFKFIMLASRAWSRGRTRPRRPWNLGGPMHTALALVLAASPLASPEARFVLQGRVLDPVRAPAPAGVAVPRPNGQP